MSRADNTQTGPVCLPLAEQMAGFLAARGGVTGDQQVEHDFRQSVISLVMAVAQGHSYLDLATHAGQPWPYAEGHAPELADWVALLQALRPVSRPGEGAEPLLYEDQRLYLYRLWQAEVRVAEAILSRLQQPPNYDAAGLRAGLAALFPHTSGVDDQQLAAALAVTQRFAVISGGPGTGKTTTLVRVLALLLEQQPTLHIRLAAPTGKAAARMMEAIRKAKQANTPHALQASAAVRAGIPEQAQTLHRLLGRGRHGWRHHRGNPLLLDCLVLDEVSMIDLDMMDRLLGSIAPDCRLILLGDRDQLASVDAGTVLDDITGQRRPLAWSPARAEQLATLTGNPVQDLSPTDSAAPLLADSIALLRTSHRFRDDAGIGQLAQAVNNGKADAAITVLRAGGQALNWQAAPEKADGLDEALAWATGLCQADDVEQALKQLDDFRILTALRQGPLGTSQLNERLRAQLIAVGKLSAQPGAVHGMPVLITQNHYGLNLFNGDTGMIWQQGQHTHAVFRQADGSHSTIPVSKLPQHEACWAMTIHKAQGSEFNQVCLLLPTEDNPLLSRELFYTGLTRAREQLRVIAAEPTIRQAINHRHQRNSSLAGRLGWQV